MALDVFVFRGNVWLMRRTEYRNKNTQNPLKQRSKTMNANELTFGIEIETTLANTTIRRENMRVGGYHSGVQVPYLPQGWTAERDSSLRTPAGHTACEIVSPVLKGEDGIRQVIEVVRILNEKGHNVNHSCGVHVHVFFDPNWSATRLASLINVVAYLEKGIYATTGTKRRERGTYCGGVRKHENAAKAKTRMDGDRYHLLNITNLANRRRPTVEFRAFSGSLNVTKIVGWIQICLGIVERAINTKRLPVWEPKKATGGWAKKGEGQSEVERLFGYLAWGEGYARLKGGKQYGWVTSAIPQDEIKKELRRLAKKYDSET
jgi:hypothetical protein